MLYSTYPSSMSSHVTAVVFLQELLLYLLQLVQALRYENIDEIHRAYKHEKSLLTSSSVMTSTIHDRPESLTPELLHREYRTRYGYACTSTSTSREYGTVCIMQFYELEPRISRMRCRMSVIFFDLCNVLKFSSKHQ